MLDCVTAESLCPPLPQPQTLCEQRLRSLRRACCPPYPFASARRGRTTGRENLAREAPARRLAFAGLVGSPRQSKGFRDHAPEVFRRRGACVKTAKRNGSQVFENKQSGEITDSAPLMISMAYYEECEAFRFALRNDFRIFGAADDSDRCNGDHPLSRWRSAANKPLIAHRLSMPLAPRHCRPQQR